MANQVNYSEMNLEELKDHIRRRMAQSDEWLIRGILAIHAKQTADEQAQHTTKYNNNVGFNGVDAPFLSSLADFYNRRGYLTPRQIVAGRRKMRKYAGQLARITLENTQMEAA